MAYLSSLRPTGIGFLMSLYFPPVMALLSVFTLIYSHLTKSGTSDKYVFRRTTFSGTLTLMPKVLKSLGLFWVRANIVLVFSVVTTSGVLCDGFLEDSSCMKSS